MRYKFCFKLLLLLTIIGLLLVYNNIYASNLDEVKISPEMQKIMEREKLIVGLYYQDMPPFFMTDEEGKLDGLDIELARKIADYLEIEVEFNREAESYQQLFEMVVGGEVDVVISKFSKTFKRARVIRYTEPYVTFRRALMLNSSFAIKNKIKDYPMTYLRTAHIKVGVKANTSYVEFSRELFTNAEIVQLDTWEEVISALKKGEVVAAMYDENEVLKLLHKNSDIAVFASVYILKDQKDYIAMAVPYESTQLLSWLNFFLENFQINYTVNDLITKYPEIYK